MFVWGVMAAGVSMRGVEVGGPVCYRYYYCYIGVVNVCYF